MAEFIDEAHRIVDAAIKSACRRLSGLTDFQQHQKKEIDEVALRKELELKAQKAKDDYLNTIGIIDDQTFAHISNITWTSIEDFTVDEGLSDILKFIKTWKRDSSWLHCIDFLKEDDLPYSKRFRYEVKWSIPTRRKPIPRATASTYFTLEVSKIKPKDYPIEVFYIFEGHQFVHRPGKSEFNAKWLRDIIESKVCLMEAITF
ncbi:A-kinase anchor protein 14-like isoform X2 [Xenia sp. Carnegie-2017]|uniref:A-kinase anchor protein 14-like isoform X2 n=1 Tax=Xenia sp. Carnegie-2017 TaxID=2897299 RepID=UPI001F043ADD|nr:A-kinase anchor protein 14-like isoform X2 [Xenia sp. Carnegie-2017]